MYTRDRTGAARLRRTTASPNFLWCCVHVCPIRCPALAKFMRRICSCGTKCLAHVSACPQDFNSLAAERASCKTSQQPRQLQGACLGSDCKRAAATAAWAWRQQQRCSAFPRTGQPVTAGRATAAGSCPPRRQPAAGPWRRCPAAAAARTAPGPRPAPRPAAAPQRGRRRRPPPSAVAAAGMVEGLRVGGVRG